MKSFLRRDSWRSLRAAAYAVACAGSVSAVQSASAAEPYVLYRVNAGGPALPSNDGGALWMADNTNDADGTTFHTSGSATFSGSINSTDDTVPPATQLGIFGTQRFDRIGGNDLQWNFPVQEGVEVEVRVYFADIWSGSAAPGSRRFTVKVDGQPLVSDFDISATVGPSIGTMRSLTLVSDGNIDLDFIHGIETPLVSGVEIIDTQGELTPEDAGGPASFGAALPSPDTKFVYVSSSIGDDANDGRSPRTPKATLEAATGLLRDGSPDWLLLRRGDTWNEGIGSLLPSGESVADPLIVAPFGSGDNPRVVASNSVGALPAGDFVRMLDINIAVEGEGFEWDRPVPSADSRVIFVSNSTGSDSNDGLSPETAVRSIDRGYALLRDGYPDWLMLRRGDVFQNEGLGEFRPNAPMALWTKDGRSEAEPMVVSTFGEGPRPKLIPPGEHGVQIAGADHLRILSVEFSLGDRAPTDKDFAVRFLAPGSDVQFVDIRAQGFSKAFVIQANEGHGGISDVLLYRCVVLDSHEGRSSGAFIYRVEDLKIVECVFDHNGWLPGETRSIFNHNIYSKESFPFLLQGNILSRGASFGATVSNDSVETQLRDITIRDNLMIGNANQFSVSKTGPAPEILNLAINGNAVFDAGERWVDANGNVREGSAYGFDVADARGLSVTDNIFLDSPESFNVFSFGVRYGNNSENVVVANNTASSFEDWDRYIDFADPELQYSGNRIYGSLSGLPGAPTIEAYDATIGGNGSVESFLDGARAQSMSNWKYEYTAAAVINYLRSSLGN